MKKILVVLLFLCLSVLNSANAQDNSAIQTITENGYEISSKGLASAVAYGDVKTVKAFLALDYKADSKVGKLPLTFYAVMNEKPEVLNELLAAGANPNQTWGKVTLLTTSVEKKNPEMVKILIKHKTDVNKTTYKITPLNFALIKKQYEIAEILLDAGAIPDKKSESLVKKLKDNKIKEKILNYNK